MRAPIHPGEILATEFLDELEITAYALAQRSVGRVIERDVSAMA